eukprot:GABU01001352.1.p2 GENE.GABU01001352.1~~GABU01001352.1.p2  ORF type:complete len:111 (-),score=14.35 GABU01001352.1:77-385(-)
MLNTKFKTTMCRSIETGTPCIKGDNCHFAHSQAELRAIDAPLPDNAPLYPNKPNNGVGGRGGFRGSWNPQRLQRRQLLQAISDQDRCHRLRPELQDSFMQIL